MVFFFTRSSCLWINEVGKRFALQSDISGCECIAHKMVSSTHTFGIWFRCSWRWWGLFVQITSYVYFSDPRSLSIHRATVCVQRLIRFKKLRLELLLHIVNVKQINFFNMIWNFKWHMRVRAGTINTKLYCASQSCCSSISTNISVPFNNNRQII